MIMPGKKDKTIKPLPPVLNYIRRLNYASQKYFMSMTTTSITKKKKKKKQKKKKQKKRKRSIKGFLLIKINTCWEIY